MKIFNGMRLIIFLTSIIRADLFFSQSSCSFNLGNDTTLCLNGATTFSHLIAGPPGCTSYLWSPSGNTTMNETVTSPGLYSCTTTTAGPNLVVNGSFNSGNTGFTSAYVYNPGGGFGPLSIAQSYFITTNPQIAHTNFNVFGDHTTGTGNMYVGNGATNANVSLWTQTINVVPNKTYRLSAWLRSAIANISTAGQAKMDFLINGILVGSTYNVPVTPNWNNYVGIWNSLTNTTATITIVDVNLQGNENDFAMDDISFQEICTYSDAILISTSQKPIVDAGPPMILPCSPNFISLNAVPQLGSSYAWTGPGIVSGANSISPIVNAVGKYVLTATNTAGCKTKDSTNVTAPILPLASIAPHSNISCANNTVTLIGSSSIQGVVPSWSGPSGIVNGNTFSATVNQAGTYVLTLISPENCIGTAQTVVTATSNITSLITDSSSSGCSSLGSITINAINGGLAPYKISNGITTTTGVTNLPFVFNNLAAQTYSITILDANNCQFQKSKTVLPAPLITSIVSSNSPFSCSTNNGKLSVTNVQGGTPPYTITANNTIAGSTFPIHLNSLAPGSYIIQAIDSKGCDFTKNINISLASDPVITSILPTNITCNGLKNGKLQANVIGSAPFNYTWNPAPSGGQGGVLASGFGVGNYSLTVTDNNGCKSISSASITEPAILIPKIVGDSVFCKGSQLNLNASAVGGVGNYQYAWSNVPHGTGSIYFFPEATQTITVKVTDANGCEKSISYPIRMQVPQVDFSTDSKAGCAPYCATFSPVKEQNKYKWSFGDGTYSSEKVPKHCYSVSGDYSVSLKVTDELGCENTKVYNNYIKVYPAPVSSIQANPTITTMPESTVSFYGISDGTVKQWAWNFDDNGMGTSNLQNPNYTYLNPGIHQVQLITSNENSCKDTTETTVIIEHKVTFFAPNAFTPNGDNYNKEWHVRGIGLNKETYHLMIFNKWGQVVFESKDMDEGWDGKSEGKVLNDDLYIWQVNIMDKNGVNRSYTGKVSILK